MPMTDTQLHAFRDTANIGPSDRAGVRHAVFEGEDHLVVPVVMIVEGVLNGALVPASEFSRYVEAWNGQPVPVLHPEREGSPVSANSPDIIERNTIGRLFNCYAENSKLKGEAWINVNKAQRLGHNELLTALEAGEVVEVSTGYFADGEPKAGEYNGNQYQEIHRNIRPDHLALLPGEEGACSVADGCGTRVNKGIKVKVNEAMNVLRQAVGLQTQCSGGCTGQCNCKGGDMPDKKTLVQRAEQLRSNEKLTSDQMEMLQNLAEDQQQLAMAKAFLDAVEASGGEPSEPMEPDEMVEDEEMLSRMASNSKLVDKLNNLAANSGNGNGNGNGNGPNGERNGALTQEQMDQLVSNRVDEAVRRRDVMAKLATNEACPFDESEMKAMSVDHLEKLEKSIRPADYSGAGGFASNSNAIDTNVQPLVPQGALKRKNKEA